MYQTINFYDFCKAFRDHGREDQFSYAAKRLIFDHLEEIEDYELDVIALCCAYAEDDEDDTRRNYSIKGDVLDWLQDNTIVVGVTPDGAIVYCSEF